MKIKDFIIKASEYINDIEDYLEISLTRYNKAKLADALLYLSKGDITALPNLDFNKVMEVVIAGEAPVFFNEKNF